MLELISNRRREARIVQSCSVVIHGTDAQGRKIKARGVTENISSGGVFLKLEQEPLNGSVFALIELPNHVRLAAKGRVLRSNRLGALSHGMAVSFRKTRLLPAS